MLHRNLVFPLLVCASLSAQWNNSIDERRATIRGGGGDSGKCTIEVQVDGVVEVEILGELGRLRTVSGTPASWRRFECNNAMPVNPSDFRFKGVDGRGRQELVRSPGNRRPAVIRIEDPKGGSEGYTFDIEWRGSGSPGSGWGGVGGSGSGWGGSGGSSGSGSGWGGSGNSGSGWGGSGGSGWGGSANELRYSGNGSGTFSNANGMRDDLRGSRVFIDRNGNVDVTFRTSQSGNVVLKGRVINVNGDRINADMSGNGISGRMALFTNGPNRVREIQMNGNSPVRFDLRWRE